MHSSPENKQSKKSRNKLLIVDDEEDNLDLLQRIFHRSHLILLAKNGFEALAILANEPDIAVIVSDQRMPMMSGTEFLSQVADHYPDTLRIILTAHTDVDDLVEAINQSKVFKYITKPFKVEDLVEVVQQATEIHKLLQLRTSKLRNDLENAEARYQGIFENAIEGIFQTTIDGRYLIANSMLAQIYGYPSAESLISNVTNIANQIYVNPLRRQEFINVLRTHDTVSNFESQVYRRDGTKIWISENVRAVRNFDGTLIGFEGTVQDISQRKRAEEESQLLQCLTLEISAANDFQTALEVALTKICQFTGWDYGEAWIPAGNEHLICSPAWYSSIDGLGNFRQISERISFSTGLGFPGRVWENQRPEWIWDISLEAESNFLRKYPALECGLRSGLAIPVSADTNVVSIMVFFTRIPNDRDQQLVGLIGAIAMQLGILMRRKRDEETLRLVNEELALARDRALEASRTKSTFVANMSHELRTPLNAIIGYSEMLEEDAALLGLDDFKDDLQKIYRSGKHLLDLINDILDMTKIEAGKLEIYYDDFDVPMLIFDTSKTIQPLLLKNNNRLEIECDLQLGEIRADMTRLRQVLLNILSNACKFTKSGEIKIQVNRHNYVQGEFFCFTISDTGIGISPANLQRLFQPFNQADSSTTRQYGGTGLGLAISHRLCQMMNGDISVTSELGQGSTFTICLPVDCERAIKNLPTKGQNSSPNLSILPQSLSNKADDSQQKHPAILVISDDPMIHQSTHSSLNHLGVSIYSSLSGENAMKLVYQILPDAIIVDMQTPSMRGWEMLKELKSQPLTSGIPIILLTISDNDETHQSYEIGANDYLFKPIDRDRLISIIDKYRTEQNSKISVLVIEDDSNTRAMLKRILEKEGCVVSEAQDGHVALESMMHQLPQIILLDLMMPNSDGFEFIHLLRLRYNTPPIPIIIITAKDLTNADCIRLSGSFQKILQKTNYSYTQLLEEIVQRLYKLGVLAN
ncbi:MULTISPECIES: response regulator [Pseudanabaena]|jgi:PAS domain S-box-containing protein|uniref:response regulator n=1 Tax=Pseudanabaena TaxID=1152 RepID=UPI00247A20A8|nr:MULTISPECIES: response regulator [Pseudanabaena]MEA5488713.1 response regulator [Pseudanabaena sp. CCNP1317]WGS71214.1 response regulator [Pseudanabaena galeata CCNP1313]